MQVKTGRNDPCPCGSGKKFKKCCFDKAEIRAPLSSVAAKSSAPPVAEMNRLLSLFNAGRHAEAEDLSRMLLDRNPDFGVLWMMLGLLLERQGKDAHVALQRATELMPEDADAHSHLGVALRRLGRLDEAVAACRRAVQIKPGYADGHSNLGNVLRDLRRFADAEASYRRALEINPDFAVAHSNLGNVLKDRGRIEDAAASFRRAIRLNPELAGAHSNLGIALRDLGQFDAALACYRRALGLNPNLAEAHSNLGVALRDLEQFDAALASYRRALELNPDFAEALSNLGSILSELGQFDAAVAAYRRALSVEPRHTDALGNLGCVLMQLGEPAEAERLLSRAIESSPENARALAMALSYVPYRTEDPRFIHLESVYARRASLPVDDRIKLNFAVGKALETNKQYEASFAAYAEGNRLHHALHPFDEAADARRVKAWCSSFTPRLFEACAGATARFDANHDDPVPIFIVGMPRSGTTLIEQMLASHPQVFGAGELTAIGELTQRAERLSFDAPYREATLAALRQLGREYLERLAALAPGKRYVTDKMPENYQSLWLIHLMLPTAKILHAVRDPLDTCFSCYALRFTSGHEYSYDLAMLGGRYGRYRTLMTHWHAVLPAGRILDVNYEDTVAAPEREARRMLEHLGVDWDPACLRFYESTRIVRTASFSQVRQPIYASSVARWRHFAAHLAPLQAALRTEAAVSTRAGEHSGSAAR